jgi:hypothetical protein
MVAAYRRCALAARIASYSGKPNLRARRYIRQKRRMRIQGSFSCRIGHSPSLLQFHQCSNEQFVVFALATNAFDRLIVHDQDGHMAKRRARTKRGLTPMSLSSRLA